MSTAADGTSRRAFLGRAAGAAAVVAGAGAGVGTFARSAAAADQRSYTAGRFALEIDGVYCGAPASVDGGDLDGDVILDVVGSDGIQRKHVAGVKYEDFSLRVGSGMGKGMYDWIQASFDKGVVRKNGAIHSADFNWREKSSTRASSMFISSVTIPSLDASSKDPAYITVTASCPKVTVTKGSGAPVQAAKQKHWQPANFVFEIGGVDTSRVASIDSFTWKCTVAADGSVVMDVSDISVSFPRADVASWLAWYRNQINGQNDERGGALTLLGGNGGAVVTIGLANLGLYRLAHEIATGKNQSSNRVRATMYCEQLVWDSRSQVWG